MNTDVDEKVRKFYKLKEQYDNERMATLQSNKPKHFKCISCRRLVGSTFKTIANADGTRNLFAVCGDSITPCKFNLNIHLGATVNNEDELVLYNKKISGLKKDIILGKNDLLFGYVSRENALEKFNKLKEEMTRDTDVYEKEFQLYTNTVNNLDKITKTIETQNKITDTVADFQNLIRQYSKTSEQSFINDGIDKYINTLLPELAVYRELTVPLTAKDFEMNYDDPRVISDEFGPIISHKINTRKRKVTTKKTVTQKTRDWPQSPEDSPPTAQNTALWPPSPEDSPPTAQKTRDWPSTPEDSPPSEVNYNMASKSMLLESNLIDTPPDSPYPVSKSAAPMPPPPPPTTIVQHIYSPTPVPMSMPAATSSGPPSSQAPPHNDDELIEFDVPTVSKLEENSYDLNPHD